MPRYKLTVEYDGTPYAGWQRQENAHTVQAAIEQAIFRFCGEHVALGAAGRTDAGVHAMAQIAHVDLTKNWSSSKVREALNAHLIVAGETVGIINVELVQDSFDARFSATGRHYLYRIVNRRPPAPLEAYRAWWVKKPLHAEAMHEAAQRLIGTHDFTTFRATQCQSKSPVKTLDYLSVSRNGEIIEIRASARSFLHNQIRSFVGTLNEVGCGRWDADDVTAALEARDRKACGPVAPPYGLYLVCVDYPITTGSGREIPRTF
ncbi:tRNA pseudouridine(38-40) synthase TruA [Phyllobacterium endophyticum]|uniref:tRNA pseudouridine synthase A n=1 Tax=Phyllobacterium endophyticum TaxID=1149773 RepID=A0A2P7B0D1_9HYPH|nr:tRNA pseudouridine(38-40) synthase TruA [Phyllobacterium endophyticum]MBB3235436.1 tRNA pseudouridine38-40 synthase [Phyllobacterium endophyticum]PSH59911.1 tRNA pseudouridine(38-40) synthase TruA [Phyllobacterium endophyticum]TYR42066.1 tRNA pseudouridine(38-40) synthase TruA [Phyllobacterium endophyticum]